MDHNIAAAISRLPQAAASDFASALRWGSKARRDDGYLVLSTPENPGYHEGNAIYAYSERPTPHDLVAAFAWEFPDAQHCRISLVGTPVREEWQALGLELEATTPLSSMSAPLATEPPTGVEVRPLVSAEDWEAQVALDRAVNDASEDPYDRDEFAAFSASQARLRHGVSQRGEGYWVGAFDGPKLVASVGIAVAAGVARYDNVATHPEYRARGIARHLLGDAGDWAAEQGAHEWLIVAESGTAAERLYRRAGFSPGPTEWSAYSDERTNPPATSHTVDN